MRPMPSLRPLRRLRWKLTLSYTLVTVGALVAVELLALVAVAYLLLQTDVVISALARAAITVPTDQPVFLEDPPDAAELDRWLRAYFADPSAQSDGAGLRLMFDDPSGPNRVLVLDPVGRYLAGLPEGLGVAGEPFDTAELPGLAALLPRAIAGEEDPDELATRAGTSLVAAAPIRAEDGQVVAVLVMGFDVWALAKSAFPGLLSLVASSAAAFTILAGAIGTVFGAFTARGLARRLHRLSQAADSWSHGDFSALTEDRSPDEIGELGRHLNRMAEQLQNLLEARQELATLEERNRLARDLHDSVKQQVFAASMQLAAARALLESDPASAAARLDEAAALAQQAQRELTGLVRELRPAALEGKSLVEALRDHMPSWSRQMGVNISLRAREERSLSPDLEQGLFRVAQEALSNVARHSGAISATVSLEWADDGFSMSIADTGRGFDPAVTAPGLGLKSMRERVEALGGTMTVRAAPAEGATLTFRFPCPVAERPGRAEAAPEER